MAIPSLYAFNQLPLSEQLGIVLNEGTYLTMRFGEEGDRINLYHLGSFFAEVYYDPEVNHLHRCRTFNTAGSLDAYTDQIRQPQRLLLFYKLGGVARGLVTQQVKAGG